MKLHVSPLWDADGNLHFKLFEHGKGDTPLAMLTDDELMHTIDRFEGTYEIAKKLDQERREAYDPLRYHGSFPFKMPLLSQTQKDSPIHLAWIGVKEGSRIPAGTVLFEVETDKASNAVSAEEHMQITGILRKPGDLLRVGDAVLMYAPLTDEAIKHDQMDS